MTQKITIKHDDFGVIEVEKSGAISIEWHGNIMKVVASQHSDNGIECNIISDLDGVKVTEWFIQDVKSKCDKCLSSGMEEEINNAFMKMAEITMRHFPEESHKLPRTFLNLGD